MQALVGLLPIVASIVMLVGSIMVLVEAFKESTGWGIASLLVPFVILVFAITRWERSKKGVMIWAIGFAVLVVAILLAVVFATSVPPSEIAPKA